MTTVNIHEAKSQLSKLIKQSLSGKEVVIAHGGVPVVKLTPIAGALPPRQGGQLRGLINIADDFDAPLPESIMGDFHKKDL